MHKIVTLDSDLLSYFLLDYSGEVSAAFRSAQRVNAGDEIRYNEGRYIVKEASRVKAGRRFEWHVRGRKLAA